MSAARNPISTDLQTKKLTCSVIVCAYNEEQLLPECLASLIVQTRPPDEIIVVNNASTDRTKAVAEAVPGVKVIDEPDKGLVRARVAGHRVSTGSLLAYIDADCRAQSTWLASAEREFHRRPSTAAVTAGYRFYDWDLWSRLLLKLYDWLVAPLTHLGLQRVFRAGAILYGGNFIVRRRALEAIGGFDPTIDFHGEDTNLGRRLINVGFVRLAPQCWVYTSARRYKALGRLQVFRLYLRNFWSEVLSHRPRDMNHKDIRYNS